MSRESEAGGSVEGIRQTLATPALIVDLDILEVNLAAVAERCRIAGKLLRPHVKGHKCVALARRQLAHGAHGLGCTTMAEAELMVEAGPASILLTSPIGRTVRPSRISQLIGNTDEVLFVVDSREGLETYLSCIEASQKEMRLLIDIDVGQRRTGIPAEDTERVVALARAIRETDGLGFAGLQAYYGHLQAIAGFEERAAAARQQQRSIAECVTALDEAGLRPGIVSGGGTGTLLIDTESSPFTELQPGSYPFLDVQYSRTRLAPDGLGALRPSLFVRGEVVSSVQPDRVTINVGMKAVSTDGGPPVLVPASPMIGDYVFAGDEHGFLMLEGPNDGITPGTQVELIPSHCDTTVNLHATIYAARGDDIEAVWPIGARGVW